MTPMKARPRAAALAGPLLVLWVVLLSGAFAAAQPARSGPRHAPDTILVRFKASAPPSERTQAHALIGARVHRSFTRLEGLPVVRLPTGLAVEHATQHCRPQPPRR